MTSTSVAEVSPARATDILASPAQDRHNVQIWDFTLAPEASEHLVAQASQSPSPYCDFMHYAIVCRKLVALLPDPLLLLLSLFRTYAKAPGAMIMRGLPIDVPLPPTPSDGGRANKTTFVTEAMLGMIAHIFGEPYSYASEKKGEIVQNIVPVPSKEHMRSNEGSLSDFLLHTENAFFDFRPDYLLLFGLRAGGSLAATTVVYARDALALLDDVTIRTLSRPLFRISAPESFRAGHDRQVWSPPTPVILGDRDMPESRLNFNGITALTSTAVKALDALQAACSRVMVKICLQPGEMLVIDNRKALHGRTPFAPGFGPEARWLQRAYVRSNLWAGRTFVACRPNLISG